MIHGSILVSTIFLESLFLLMKSSRNVIMVILNIFILLKSITLYLLKLITFNKELKIKNYESIGI